MRRSPQIAPRPCEICGVTYTPVGNSQKHCPSCKVIRNKERRRKWYMKTHPDAAPKTKCQDVCCICGETFSSHFEGKPYCNKHYLRMKNTGKAEIIPRKSTSSFKIEGDKLLIFPSKGGLILADASDYESLSKYSWCIDRRGYAVARINGKIQSMHRFLLCGNCRDDRYVDHIDRDPLNNRRGNLRLCEPKENMRNIGVSKSNKVGHLGIRMTKDGKYNVRIVADRVEHHIGNYETLEEAIKARHEAEDKYHGEFASHKGGKQ